MKAGFIGTGSMGAPLAANLLDQEKSLVVYDINPEATIRLAEKQARIVNSPVAVADKVRYGLRLHAEHLKVSARS